MTGASPRRRRSRCRTDAAGLPQGGSALRRDRYLGQELRPRPVSVGGQSLLPACGTPFEHLSSVEGLSEAWQMVLVKDARDGVLQRQTRAIAADPIGFLQDLSTALREGTYRPEPLLRLDIPKREPGQTRMLHIPTIRDRVVERAVVNTITFAADMVMSACSFAYRHGLGADDAVDHLAMLRQEGYRYVLRTDVEDYFPNADVEDALKLL